MRTIQLTFTFALFSLFCAAQSFVEVYTDIEKNPSIQSEAKQMCLDKEMPLSIYIEGEALIEAFMIKEKSPLYGVIVDFLSPTNGGYFATFEEISDQFDLEGAQMNYGEGRIVNDRIKSRQAPASLPTLFLAIPETTNDRIMAFDPFSGDLLLEDFIPSDPVNLSTPIAAIELPGTENILVSDQLDDAIRTYNCDGVLQGTFAGNDNNILDNIRGISSNLEENAVLVSVGGGTNDDAIAEFDLSGNYLGNFIANGSGGLDSPFDITYHPNLNEYLVSGITSDAIHKYDVNGNSLGIFANVNTFPEQITVADDGRVLVGNFSGAQEGVLVYAQNGIFITQTDPPSLGSYRGVYLLGNGNLLTTNGGGVHEIDFSGNLISTKISGVSARFIHEINSGPASTIPTLGQWGIIILTLLIICIGLLFLRSIHFSQFRYRS